MDVSNEQIRYALLSVAAFVVSVTFHEFGHAIVADRLGDGLPRAQGRVSLSPLRHIDLLGTIIVPLVAALAAGLPLIAWGKPVQTDPSAMTTRFPRSINNLLVSVAGPMMNLLLAVVVSFVLLALSRSGTISRELALTIIQFMVVLNISLMFFNLLPIPPLDGAAILALVLPARASRVLPALQQYGMIILLVLFATPVGALLMLPARMLAVAWSNALMSFVPA